MGIMRSKGKYGVDMIITLLFTYLVRMISLPSMQIKMTSDLPFILPIIIDNDGHELHFGTHL
jgi:hypothetical protein